MTHPIPTSIVPAAKTRSSNSRWQERYRRVPRTVVLTNTRTPPCMSSRECTHRVREIREKHMRQGHPDIQHNFLIGGDGNVYEGRGWDVASTEYSDIEGETIDIAFIDRIHDGQWGDVFQMKMERAIPFLLFDGVTKGYLRKDFTVIRKMWLEPDRSSLPYLIIWIVSFSSLMYRFLS